MSGFWTVYQPRVPVAMLPESISGLQAFDPKVAADAAIVMIFIRPSKATGELAHILFTERSTTVKTHKGQIGFPGGHRELGDKDLRETALRETEEEIGIVAAKITLHGCLPIVTTPDARRVLPFVATTEVVPDSLRPCADEVAAIITRPWDVCTRSAKLNREFVLFGKTRQTVIYDANFTKIWGLTAKVIEAADLTDGT